MNGYRLYRLGGHGLGLCDMDTGRISAMAWGNNGRAVAEGYLVSSAAGAYGHSELTPGARAILLCDIPASCHPATLAAIKECVRHPELVCEVWDVLPDAGAFNLQGGM